MSPLVRSNVIDQHQSGGAAEARAALSDKGGTVLHLLRYTRSRDLQATLKRMPPAKQQIIDTTTSTTAAANDTSSDAASVQHSTSSTTDKAVMRNGSVQDVVADSSSSKSKQAVGSRVEAMRTLLSRSKQR
jgi:hypothetical protein